MLHVNYSSIKLEKIKNNGYANIEKKFMWISTVWTNWLLPLWVIENWSKKHIKHGSIGHTFSWLYYLLLKNEKNVFTTYHQVSNDHDHHEDSKAHGLTSDLHAVPHGLYPLSTQHPEHNQEGVEEVIHVPAWELTLTVDLANTVFVAFTKELHADHSKNEDNDSQHQGQVT